MYVKKLIDFRIGMTLCVSKASPCQRISNSQFIITYSLIRCSGFLFTKKKRRCELQNLLSSKLMNDERMRFVCHPTHSFFVFNFCELHDIMNNCDFNFFNRQTDVAGAYAKCLIGVHFFFCCSLVPVFFASTMFLRCI